MVGFFSFYNNLLAMGSCHIVEFHVGYSRQSIESMRFWATLINKYFSYLVLVIVKFNIFLGDRSSSFSKTINGSFKGNFFKCYEDQAALNLALFVTLINSR